MDFLYAIAGVVLGVILNEFIRRNNRTEILNNQIFNRRLEEYIKLHDLLVNQYQMVLDLLDNFSDFNDEEKLEIISNIILPIVTFNDKKSFFLSEELILQTSTLFMGIEDSKDSDLEKLKIKIGNDYQKTMEMIKNESGIKKVNKNFKSILKYKHNSPIIEYYKKQKNQKNRSSFFNG